MSILARLALALFLAVAPISTGIALDAPPTAVSQQLVPFASEEGLARLARSNAKLDFPLLANQFEPQSNGAFCGPTSAAIVLNTIRAHATDLPRDHSRLHPEDLQYMPEAADPTLPRYTQDNVIAKGLKTRAQVLGEPVTVNGKTIRDFGYQIRQLDEMLRANGVSTKLVVVNDDLPEADIRNDLVQSLSQPGHYVIVGFLRRAAGEKGGGHISPLGAYDAQSDSFLLLDVNPTAAGWA